MDVGSAGTAGLSIAGVKAANQQTIADGVAASQLLSGAQQVAEAASESTGTGLPPSPNASRGQNLDISV